MLVIVPRKRELGGCVNLGQRYRRGGTIHVNSSVVPGTNGSCFTIQMPATSLLAKTAH
jgi:hypothetical protein